MKLRSFFFFLLLAPGVVQAQSLLEADAAAFRLDSTRDQVEVYYGVLQRGLNFTQSGNAWVAPFNARVEIWQNGKAIEKKDISQQIRYECTKDQLDSIGASKLLGVTAFAVPYAENTYAAFIWQRGSANAADTIRSERLALPKLKSDQIELGGIELGSSLTPLQGGTSPFEKNGYILSPNPSSVYGENYTKLYYYTELYVPREQVDPSQSRTITTRILAGDGKQLLANSQKQALGGSVIPMIVGLDIDGLPQDRYQLEVQVKEGEGVVAQARKTFFFVSGMQLSEEGSSTKPATMSIDEIYAASPFASMSEAAVEELTEQSLYVGTESDRKAAKQMKTLDAKRRFLFDFWTRKDAPGSTPLSAYSEYQQRLSYVAQKYSYQRTPGWKTGRGRIYLIYGPPQYVTDEEFNTETKPYITWEYDPMQNVRTNSGTRVQFVFLDRQGGGNFVLVHSNVVGEVNNPDWYSNEARRLAH